MNDVVKGKLSNAQLELLQLFSRQMSDEEVLELRNYLAQFYAKKAMDEADRLWEERGYTQNTMEDWLSDEHKHANRSRH